MNENFEIISIKITPKASKSEIVGWENEVLKIRISEVPEKGKANIELIRLLAKEYKLPKSAITIISGETSRLKRVKINKEGKPS